MSRMHENIKHVVVLMMENRSFDNLGGWLYDNCDKPRHVLPPPSDGSPIFMGLTGTGYSQEGAT